MSEEFRCILCSGREATPFLLDCKDYYLAKEFRASYYQCSSCGLVQQNPIPSDVSGFYADYPVHRHKASLFEFVRRIIMKPCYFDLHELHGGPGGNLVLMDFGCGDGWFLDSIEDDRVVRVGFELDREQAARVSNDVHVPVFSSASEVLSEYRGKADVITMHFVMEHITDWYGTFALLRDLLKPDGMVFITVPNIASWEFRLFGRKWHNLDPPRHIAFPSQSAIERIARVSGLKLERSYAIPFPNGVAGSLSAVITGRFRFGAYLAALPLGILLSRIFPGGNRAYVLKADPESQRGSTNRSFASA